MSTLNILAGIRPGVAPQYESYLRNNTGHHIHTVTTHDALKKTLNQSNRRVDMLLIDHALGDVFRFIRTIRHEYPRLLIILIDEEADLSIPGQADDVSTTPFQDDDLIHRIEDLIQERQTETLRADTLPPVRSVAQRLHAEETPYGKIQVTLDAVAELGYDFVAYYALQADGTMMLGPTAGARTITSLAPPHQKADSLVSQVVAKKCSTIVASEDSPNYSLIKKGRLGAGACIAVGGKQATSVILVGREMPDSIAQEHMMMLELMAAQLAVALTKTT